MKTWQATSRGASFLAEKVGDESKNVWHATTKVASSISAYLLSSDKPQEQIRTKIDEKAVISDTAGKEEAKI